MIALGLVEHGWAGAGEIDRLHREHCSDLPVVAYRLEGSDDPILSALGDLMLPNVGDGWRFGIVPLARLREVLPKLSGVRRMQIERALGEKVDEMWRGVRG